MANKDKKKNNEKNKKSLNALYYSILIVVIIALIALLVYMYFNNQNKNEDKEVPYTQLIKDIEEEKIEKIEMTLGSNTIKVKYKDIEEEKTAIILTTLIFSIMHFELSQIIYTLIVGYFLTYLYSKTNNLKTSIISHITINTATILLIPLVLNTNIYIQSGILILIILSLFQIFSIKQK